MEQSIAESISAHHDRERRIDQRMEIIAWLALRWQNFRLLQEAALWRHPGQPVPLDHDLAQRYYRSPGALLVYLREAEKLGLVEVIADTDAAEGASAFQITQDKQSVAGQLIEALFQ